MKYRLFLVIFVSSILNILLGTFYKSLMNRLGGLFFTVPCLKQEFFFLPIKGLRSKSRRQTFKTVLNLFLGKRYGFKFFCLSL